MSIKVIYLIDLLLVLVILDLYHFFLNYLIPMAIYLSYDLLGILEDLMASLNLIVTQKVNLSEVLVAQKVNLMAQLILNIEIILSINQDVLLTSQNYFTQLFILCFHIIFYIMKDKVRLIYFDFIKSEKLQETNFQRMINFERPIDINLVLIPSCFDCN